MSNSTLYNYLFIIKQPEVSTRTKAKDMQCY